MGPKQIEYMYTNHKWPTHILNALVFMFLGVRFKKMCGFVNLFLKPNIYVLSSRFENFRYSENDIPSFSFKSLKNWNILFTYVWRYYCENGSFSFIWKGFKFFVSHIGSNG
jgi:hypothetical protein